MTIRLEKGHRLRLDSPVLKVRADRDSSPLLAEIPSFRMSVYGHKRGERGYFIEYRATEEMAGLDRNITIPLPEGKGDTFYSGVLFEAEMPKEFTLELPTMYIDGVPITAGPIRFAYREQRYVSTCIQ